MENHTIRWKKVGEVLIPGTAKGFSCPHHVQTTCRAYPAF